MKIAGTLVKSGLAVAGAGIYLFFRRLFKKAKKTEKEIEEKIKTKKTYSKISSEKSDSALS